MLEQFEVYLRVTDRLFAAVDRVKAFARSVGDIFYDLYIEVVGNSTWPDLVDGVVAYADFLIGAVRKVAQFGKDVGRIFVDLLETWTGLDFSSALFTPKGFLYALNEVKYRLSLLPQDFARIFKQIGDTMEGIFGTRNPGEIIGKALLAVAGGIASILGDILKGAFFVVYAVFKLVPPLLIETLSRGLSAAFIAAFAALAVAGGLSGGLGAAIATGFIGVVGAYFAGFASNFSAVGAIVNEGGIFREIAENQENILFTITDGLGAITRILGDTLRVVSGGNPAILILEKTLDTLADNMAAFLLSLPLLIGALKSLRNIGGGASAILTGNLVDNISNAAGERAQRATSRNTIIGLQTEQAKLQAQMEGLNQSSAD